MLLADALVELCAGLLFAVLALLMLRSLHRAGTLTWNNSLALALIFVIGISAPHRGLRAARLLIALHMPNSAATLVFPEGIIVDALVLVGLVWYLLAFTRAGRVVIPGERERFALFADQVGLRQMRAELALLRDQVGLERARSAVVTEHLRQAAAPLDEVEQVALALAEESHDPEQRERLRALAGQIAIVGQLVHPLG
jgi:hypothetical protein